MDPDIQLRIAQLTGWFTILGAVVGAVIGFIGAFAVAWWQTKQAKEIARFNDLLDRKREFDREERQRRWDIQKAEAARQQKPLLQIVFDRGNPECVHPFKHETPSVICSQATGSTQRSERTDWYVNVLVRNQGGSTAVNCRGVLARLIRLEGKEWKEQPIQGTHELIWAFGKQDVQLEVGTEMPLNLFLVSDPTQP